MDDEAFGGGADVIKRIARDERQHVLGFRLEHGEVTGSHDVRVLDLVNQLTVRCMHAQLIAHANVPQRTKQPVAVGRDGAVSSFPRPRRVRQMAGRAVQRRGVVSLDDGRRHAKPRDLEQPDEARARRRISNRCLVVRHGRFGGLNRALNRHPQFLLRVRGIGGGESVPTQTCEAEDEQRALGESHSHDCPLMT